MQLIYAMKTSIPY